jgi:hypothetical protein
MRRMVSGVSVHEHVTTSTYLFELLFSCGKIFSDMPNVITRELMRMTYYGVRRHQRGGNINVWGKGLK